MSARLVAAPKSAVGGVVVVGVNVDSSSRSSTMPRLSRPLAPPTTRTFPRSRILTARATPSASKSAGGFKGFGTKKKNSSTTEKGTTPLPPWVADATACPCCSGRKLDACCGPFVGGSSLPETAEQLMRSRFAAYVLKKAEYIVETTHPENPAAAGSRRPDGTVASTLRQDVAATIKRVAWQRLKVEGVEGGGR